MALSHVDDGFFIHFSPEHRLRFRTDTCNGRDHALLALLVLVFAERSGIDRDRGARRDRGPIGRVAGHPLETLSWRVQRILRDHRGRGRTVLRCL